MLVPPSFGFSLQRYARLAVDARTPAMVKTNSRRCFRDAARALGCSLPPIVTGLGNMGSLKNSR